MLIQPLAGVSIFLMITATIVAAVSPDFPTWPSGLFAWLAGALLVSRVSAAQILQIGTLLLIGFLALAGALYLGAAPQWMRLVDSYTGLLSMIAAVSFLKLVAIQADTSVEVLPRGPAAFQRTVLAVAVLGSFINISGPLMIADRLASKNGLSAFAAQSITRAFSCCPAWSPFFGGMAVVLTYIGGADLLFVMLAGLPFAVAGLLVILFEAKIRYKQNLIDFEGYPLTISSLQVPVILAICVALGYIFLPQVSILAVVAVAAMAVCALMLFISNGPSRAVRILSSHVMYGLPGMVGELLLFLAAGVLAGGLRSLVAVTNLNIPFYSGFGIGAAALLLAAMILISVLGTHPIITIAVVTPLLVTLNPDPQLLAVTYLLGWSLGTCAGPLSGTHLIMQGRYGIPSVKGAARNWPFVAVMYVVGLIFLQLIATIRGV